MSDSAGPWPRVVTDHFRPLVHVVSSPDVDQFVSRDGLESSFAQLLVNFEANVSKVQVRNSSYESRTLDTFPVKVVKRPLPPDFAKLASQGAVSATAMAMARARSGTGTGNAQSPFRQPTESEREELFLDALNELVASSARSNPPDLSTKPADDDVQTPVHADDLFKPTPWYDAMKASVLSRREMAAWETFNQPLCVIVAVSMALEDPMSTLSALWDLTSNDKLWDAALNDNRHLWGQTDILRYVVLVRDSTQDDWNAVDAANKMHESIRKVYGLHTGILALEPDSNSANSQQAVSLFMRELVTQSLVPFMERTVIVGNEAFNSSRKGISGRLWGASKKYFGNSSSSRQGSSWDSRGFYPTGTQEAQNRRTADLAFMIGDYRLAFNIYEAIAKDYRTDNAFRFHSSSLRMAGLCHLLLASNGHPAPQSAEYLFFSSFEVPPSSSATTSPFDILRHAVLYYESYQALEQLGPAVSMLYRVGIQAEEAYSAALLEQAAFCTLFLDNERSHRRKFALYMLSASRFYEKAGIKALSLNSILLASQACPSSWTALTQFLAHSTGWQAYKMGRAEDAVEQFLRIWNSCLALSKTFSDHEAMEASDWACLDDLALAWQQCDRKDVKSVDVFDVHATRIVLQDEASFEPAPHWDRWEAILGVQPRKRAAVQGETFSVHLVARNPLHERLILTDLQLDLSAECEIQLEEPEQVVIEPRSSQLVQVPVLARGTGKIVIRGVNFLFHSVLPARQDIHRKAKRLHKTREQLLKPAYETNTELSIQVRSPVPRLVVDYAIPDSMYAGETFFTTVLLRNDGAVPIQSVTVICNSPSFLLSPKVVTESTDSNSPYQVGAATKSSVQISNSLPGESPVPVELPSKQILPGQTVETRFLLRGDGVGAHDLLITFGYQAPDGEQFSTRMRHFLDIAPSVDVRPQIRNSSSQSSAFMVSMQVINSHVPAPIVITQITTISPRWRSSVVKAPTNVISMGASDVALFSIAATTNSEANASAEECDDFAVQQLETFLRAGDMSTRRPPQLQLQMCSAGEIDASHSDVFESFLASHAALRMRTLAVQNPSIEAKDLPTIYPLFSSRSFDIVVFWACPSMGITGHSLVCDIPLGSSSDRLAAILDNAELFAGGIYAESQLERTRLVSALRKSPLAIEGRPVNIVLSVQDACSHDFSKGPCRVPARWLIRNISALRPLQFVLGLHPLQIDPANSGNLAFSGALTRRGAIEPLGQCEVSSDLFIVRPGVFDVGKWHLDVTIDGGLSWQVQGPPRTLRVQHSNNHDERR